MYFLVSLNVLSKNKVVVPLKWIKNLKLSKLLNYGTKYHRQEEYQIFFSKNTGIEPDFNLQKSFQFDESRDCCYGGRILKTFGNKRFFKLKKFQNFHEKLKYLSQFDYVILKILSSVGLCICKHTSPAKLFSIN